MNLRHARHVRTRESRGAGNEWARASNADLLIRQALFFLLSFFVILSTLGSYSRPCVNRRHVTQTVRGLARLSTYALVFQNQPPHPARKGPFLTLPATLLDSFITRSCVACFRFAPKGEKRAKLPPPTRPFSASPSSPLQPPPAPFSPSPSSPTFHRPSHLSIYTLTQTYTRNYYITLTLSLLVLSNNKT